MYACFKKGPDGRPTYDKAGFLLDYRKVADRMRPRGYNKKAIMNGMDRAIRQAEEEKEKMCAIFFRGGKPPKDGGKHTVDLIKDKVSKDLGIAWHKITPTKVKYWAERGFPKENPRDYAGSTVTAEERKRFHSLQEGSKLRK